MRSSVGRRGNRGRYTQRRRARAGTEPFRRGRSSILPREGLSKASSSLIHTPVAEAQRPETILRRIGSNPAFLAREKTTSTARVSSSATAESQAERGLDADSEARLKPHFEPLPPLCDVWWERSPVGPRNDADCAARSASRFGHTLDPKLR